MTDPSPHLTAKLLEAQRGVEGVVRRGRNADQGYDYVTASDVVTVARKAFHDAGLVAAIGDVRVDTIEPFTSDRGKRGVFASLLVALQIFDPDGPEPGAFLEFTAAGTGADYGAGDKAILKAQTAATKYVYCFALALPFVDADPERDVPGEAGRIPEQTPDPSKSLPPERIAQILEAVKFAGIKYPTLCLLLGSVGADAPKAQRRDAIQTAIAELSPDQADAVLDKLPAFVPGGEQADAPPPSSGDDLPGDDLPPVADPSPPDDADATTGEGS